MKYAATRRLVAGAVIALAASSLAPPRAEALTGCVSAGEWSRVQNGMSQRQVADLFDHTGILGYETYNNALDGIERWRYYKPCRAFGNNNALVVWFDDYAAESHPNGGTAFRVWDWYRSSTPYLEFE